MYDSAYPAYIILLNLIILIFHQEYKLQSFSSVLCSEMFIFASDNGQMPIDIVQNFHQDYDS